MNNIAAIFAAVDKDRSGQINEKELQQALSNGTGTEFNPKCVSQMIKMFDRDGSGTINMQEFQQLYGYVQNWKACFQSSDRNQSRSIDSTELTQVLHNMNYRLSPQFVQMLVIRFDRTRTGKIAFDDFIYACVCLQMLTQSFMPLDTQRNGTASMTFEQFLSAAFVIIS